MEERGLRIGEVARLTSIPGRRIRFYEERGLLEPPRRSSAGYRLYGEREVARLEFVKQAKRLGLTLREIRSLICVADGCGREPVACRLEEILDRKLRETRREISDLLILEANLRRFKERAAALERGDLQTSCEDDETGFCGCLEAVTGEAVTREEVEMENTPCACACECCEEQSCDCACECCENCA